MRKYSLRARRNLGNDVTNLKSSTAAIVQTGKAFVRLFEQHVRVRTATLIAKIWLGFKREFLNALVVCTKVPTIHLSKMLYRTCMLKKILTKLTDLKNTFRIINILLLRARFYVAKKLKRVFKSQTSPFHSNESSSSQFWPLNTEIREKQSSIAITGEGVSRHFHAM